jgi:hypothetical protein
MHVASLLTHSQIKHGHFPFRRKCRRQRAIVVANAPIAVASANWHPEASVR